MGNTSSMPLFERFKMLSQDIATYEKVLVAYSGGVDSTLLAFVAAHTLGDNAQIVMADSPLLAHGEADDARQTAALAGFSIQTIPHPGWELEAVQSNAADRCYHCKHALFEALQALDPGAAILCGDNADDIGKDRPGLQAARELGVRSPLAEHGFIKADIREVARLLKLDNAAKPSSPCLATRFPAGCPLKPALLDAVREGEHRLRRDYCFKLLRVRCDEAGNARIELGQDELDALDDAARQEVIESLEGLAFISITFDEAGYRES